MRLGCFISFSIKNNEVHCDYDNERSGSIKIEDFPEYSGKF
jgi:hypothetical protein